MSIEGIEVGALRASFVEFEVQASVVVQLLSHFGLVLGQDVGLLALCLEDRHRSALWRYDPQGMLLGFQ